MPSAPSARPPAQQKAATTPALRGPTRSSQPPQMAAEVPSNTKNRVNIQPRSNCLQLQLVVKSACSVPAAFSPNAVAAAEQPGTALPSAPTTAPVRRGPRGPRVGPAAGTRGGRRPCQCKDESREPQAGQASGYSWPER